MSVFFSRPYYNRAVQMQTLRAVIHARPCTLLLKWITKKFVKYW